MYLLKTVTPAISKILSIVGGYYLSGKLHIHYSILIFCILMENFQWYPFKLFRSYSNHEDAWYEFNDF